MPLVTYRLRAFLTHQAVQTMGSTSILFYELSLNIRYLDQKSPKHKKKVQT